MSHVAYDEMMEFLLYRIRIMSVLFRIRTRTPARQRRFENVSSFNIYLFSTFLRSKLGHNNHKDIEIVM
jgi:hypothetical protein